MGTGGRGVVAPPVEVHGVHKTFDEEPTGALDSDGAGEIMELFKRLNGHGQTILVVTHDPDIAAASSRIVEMRDGTTRITAEVA